MNKVQLIAQEIKETFCPNGITDVYYICECLDIVIHEAPIKADGYLRCENGKNFIFLKDSLDANRKKFTIAHELGHFFIDWHSELMFGCDIREMDFSRDYKPREKEANLFAAELLMPINEFAKNFSGKISYETVSAMAKFFDVSFHAALSRSMDLANEDCVVISSVDRCVKWFKCTEGFPLFIRRKKVCELSAADELFGQLNFDNKTVQEPGYVWFDNADDIQIEEQSVYFPNYGEVVSIIHLKDEF